VHNHPSGDPDPSACDKRITEAIALAARLFQINILDHVIIGDGKYFSFGDNDLLADYGEVLDSMFGK
jgi:DNA repair protein RadC